MGKGPKAVRAWLIGVLLRLRQSYDVGHVVGAMVPLSDSSLMGVAVERPRRAGAFTPNEQRCLNELLPHLQRAMQLRRKWLANTLKTTTGYAC